MKKKIYILLITMLLVPLKTQALELDLHSKYAIIYDPQTEEILYQKGKEDDIVKIASLTKIMTTIIAIENYDDFDRVVTITPEMLNGIPWDASIAGLKIGDSLYFKDLLYASLLPSGADATMSLAYLISGSLNKYVELMNAKVKELGLTQTHFVNVTGYDAEGHVSTPGEVMKILLYALENDTFRNIYTTRSYEMKNGKTVKSTIEMYNKFYNYDISHVLGSKTGYTGEAGMCMSALVESHGREFVVLTLGAEAKSQTAYNLVDTKTIIDSLDTNFENHIFFSEDDELFTIPIINSKESVYSVKIKNTYTKFLEKSTDLQKATYEYDGVNTLSFKTKKGSRIGHIKFFYEGEMLGEEDVLLETEIEISYLKYFGPKILIIFIIIGLFRISKKKKRKKKRR